MIRLLGAGTLIFWSIAIMATVGIKAADYILIGFATLLVSTIIVGAAYMFITNRLPFE